MRVRGNSQDSVRHRGSAASGIGNTRPDEGRQRERRETWRRPAPRPGDVRRGCERSAADQRTCALRASRVRAQPRGKPSVHRTRYGGPPSAPRTSSTSPSLVAWSVRFAARMMRSPFCAFIVRLLLMTQATWQDLGRGLCPVTHPSRAPRRTTRSVPKVLSSPWPLAPSSLSTW